MSDAPPCSPPPWSDITPELAGQVLRRLPERVDRVRFAAVCPQWRAAARQRPLPPPPPPVLMLDDRTFYSLPRGEGFHFPGCGGRYHSTCGNWLVFSRDDGFFLLDPFSKATMTLPGLSCVQPRWEAGDEPVVDDETLTWMEIMEIKDPKELVMHKLIVCSPHLVAALVGFPDVVGNQIVVCRPGASSWSVPAHLRFKRLRSMAFHQGELYALNFNAHDYNMDLLAVDIGVDHSTRDLWVSRIRLVIKPEDALLPGNGATIRTMLYLVESRGALLMVRRNIQCRLKLACFIDDLHTRQIAVPRKSVVPRKGEFQAYEADFGRSQWNKVTTVGDDQVLFLARWSSRAVCVSQYGMPGNRIFFWDDDLQDELYLYWYNEESSSSCSTYDMANGTVSSPLPMISWKHGMVPVTWLFPRD